MISQLLNQSLKGKVAIVTGSSRGIGKAIALGLAKEGAKVLVTGTNEERTKGVSEEIVQQTGQESEFFVGDLSKEENVIAMVEKAIRQMG